jgi:tripartite-type tricarboxylate transporter receptor subunit TctC
MPKQPVAGVKTMNMRDVNLLGRVLMLIAALAAGASAAQNYPTKPVRMIVGFPPGGGTDVMARLITPKMIEAWGQQVVIDNRAGATGIIGTDLVAKAVPDGYTLLMGHVATNAIAASLFAKLPFDPARDFAPITRVSSVPHLIVVHPSLDVHTVKDLIALAKAKPGQIAFPSAGNGSTPHLAGEIFKTMAGVNLIHVPYKGSGQSVQDLLGGQVQLAFDTTPTVIQYVKAGRLRPIAVSTLKRLASLPEVPTVAESGVPGYEVTTWYGMFAPAGTPPAIVRKVFMEVARIVRLPDIKERLDGMGTEETTNASPEEFAAMVRADIAKYAKVIKAAGLRID